MHGQDEHKRPCIFEGTLGRPSNPKSRGLAAYHHLLRVPTLKLLDSLLMTALLHTVQASVCAMIFAFGREVGRYSALRLELRTVVCGSQSEAAATRCPDLRRAIADGSASPPPARIWSTARYREPCGGPGVSEPMRLRPG